MSVYSNLKNDTAIYAAKGTGFTTSSDLESKNVQDAIEEVHSISNNNDSIFPTNFIHSGRKFGTPNGLELPILSGVESISGKRVDRVDNNVSIDARKVALVYDKKDGTTSALYAFDPVTFIDNNTVGLWKPNGDATCPNLAVGVSSIAVVNDLTKSGTITAVDGRDGGYAAKGDGSTGCYISANYTGFPIGASERELNILFSANRLTADEYLCSYGVASSNSLFSAHNYNGVLGNWTGTAELSSSYGLTIGKISLASYKYDGTTLRILVNGITVYSVAATLTTAASVLHVFEHASASYQSNANIHFVELRNKCRTDQESAEMAQKLLLPICYDKSSSVYPAISTANQSLLHEYKITSSASTLEDSNTSSPLNATVTNGTLVESELGLTKALKLIGSSVISTGSFSCNSNNFAFLSVLNPKSLSSIQMLWSNEPTVAGSYGNALWIDTSGIVRLRIAGTAFALTAESIPIGKSIFLAVVIVGTTAIVYVNNISYITTLTKSLDTTANTAYILYDKYPTYFTGNVDYVAFGNVSLSQAEIAEIYDALMTTGRRSLKSLLPVDSISLGYVEAGSTAINSVNDSWWAYGRREGYKDGNRKVFLGWKYVTTGAIIPWNNNPFGTKKLKLTPVWAQDSTGRNESPMTYYTGGYGVQPVPSSSNPIIFQYGANGIVYFNSAWQTTGYVGIYAEVLEED